MRTQQWLLFGHVIGVIILFGAILLENLILIYALRARSYEQLRGATTFVPLLHRLFPAGALLILGFGIGMVAQSDAFKFGQAWIDLSLGLLILLAILGPTVQGRRIDTFSEAAQHGRSGPLTPELLAQVRDPVLRMATVGSTWLAVGILFLMARQPDWPGGWITVVVFGLVGIGVALALGRLGPASESSEPPLRTTVDTPPAN